MPDLFNTDDSAAERRIRAAGWQPYGTTRSGHRTRYWQKDGVIRREEELLLVLDELEGKESQP